MAVYVFIITLFYLYQLILRKEWHDKYKSIWQWSLYIVIVLTVSRMYLCMNALEKPFKWQYFFQSLGYSNIAIAFSILLAFIIIIPMDYTRIPRNEIENIINTIASDEKQLHIFSMNEKDPTVELIDSEKLKIRYRVSECEVNNLQLQMEYTKTLLDRFQECDYGLECNCEFGKNECKRRVILYAVKEYRLSNHVLIPPFLHLRIIIQNHQYFKRNAKSGK